MARDSFAHPHQAPALQSSPPALEPSSQPLKPPQAVQLVLLPGLPPGAQPHSLQAQSTVSPIPNRGQDRLAHTAAEALDALLPHAQCATALRVSVGCAARACLQTHPAEDCGRAHMHKGGITIHTAAMVGAATWVQRACAFQPQEAGPYAAGFKLGQFIDLILAKLGSAWVTRSTADACFSLAETHSRPSDHATSSAYSTQCKPHRCPEAGAQTQRQIGLHHFSASQVRKSAGAESQHQSHPVASVFWHTQDARVGDCAAKRNSGAYPLSSLPRMHVQTQHTCSDRASPRCLAIAEWVEIGQQDDDAANKVSP